jgi:voltage-gated potassium channel
MADSLDSSVLVAYVMDLISADGRVVLVEREAQPNEIGCLPAELRDSRILRVMRGNTSFGFWEADAIRPGDVLVVIQPTTTAAAEST